MHNIVLDVDEVVFPWLESFIAFMKKAYYDYRLYEINVSEKIVDLKMSDIDEWNFYEKFGIDRKLFLTLYRAYLAYPLSHSSPPIDYSVDFTKACSGKACIHYCTARPPFSSRSLITWLDFYQLFFTSLTMIGGSLNTVGDGYTVQFNSMHVASIKTFADKHDLYKVLKPTVVVDDKPSYIEQAVDAEVPHVYLISYKYNEEFAKKSDELGFNVVNDLNDVKKDLVCKGVL